MDLAYKLGALHVFIDKLNKEGYMSYIRLHKDAFFRQYADIGYLWQQKERRSLVLDTNGALFFSALTREPQQTEDICKRLMQGYTDVTKEQITADFMAFMGRFVPLNIVVMGSSIQEMNANEQLFSYAKAEQYIRSTKTSVKSVNTSEENVNHFLTQHFKEHPQLLSLQIEITPHCNLKCVHCYLGFGTPSHSAQTGLSTQQICRVLDEFRALGGLQVTFTGGEAMLNKDLPKLLRYARRKDLDIWVLTNAALLNDELLKTMQETNVAGVQVSLYSMVPEDHDRITQVQGSFENTKKSIERLMEANIPVQLACPVMKENFLSFETVLKWGHEHHLEVKLNSGIMARTDFTTDNLNHRINLEAQSVFIQKTLASSPVYQERLLNNPELAVSAEEPVCGAGRYMLCLEAEGDYYPCPGFKLKLGNCKENSLKEIWEDSAELNKLRALTNAAYRECLNCPSRAYCNLCPGKLYNESGGDMFKLSDYFCEVAHINRRIAEEFVAAHSKKKSTV